MSNLNMKTKILYISNTRLPSEKANSYQTMQMCNSFSKIFDEVEFWTGKSHNTKELESIKDVFGFYNIKETFKIRKFFQFDSKILFIFNEFIWANLKNFIFSVNVCFRLIKHKNSNNTFIYCRDWSFIFIFLFFKKIGLVDNKIYYESHKYYKFLSNSLTKVDGVIVINNYLFALHRDIGIKRLFLAHDGVNIDEYQEISDYVFMSTKINFKVFYTGSLFRWKGVHTLVDSLNYLPKNLELIFIGGSGQYLLDFKNYVAESSHSSRIKVIPHIPKKELLKLIEKADVFVLPNSARDKMSLFTSPIKLFEYMTSKRPIVASRLLSIEEILIDKKNAFLFDPDNAQDLAKKINLAISSDCTFVVNNAFKDVKAYTWDIRAEGIAKFITRSYHPIRLL
jgi:glycosyltransferase involved in cell wall biosynthesis